MHLVSFAGTGTYEEVAYGLDPAGPCVRTRFVAEALAELLRPSHVTLLLTEKAAAHSNRSRLEQQLLKRRTPVEPVIIPDGKSQVELWAIFTRIGGLAPAEEPLALDITHGLRSLPLVSLLAASYFHALGRLHLQALYYGAYEARDASGRAPIFDLTPMLALPNWASAARAWRNHADAGNFRTLIRDASSKAWQNGGPGPRALNGLARTLHDFTERLRLARHGIGPAAEQLQRRLHSSGGEVAEHTPPLTALLVEIAEPLSALIQPGPAGELALIRLQRKGGHLLAATLLAREWLVTLWQTHLDLPTREAAELTLHELAGRRNEEQPGALWSKLGDLRNDLAHCGWRDGPRSGAQIEAQLDEVLAVLETWAASLPNRPEGFASA